MRKSYVCGVKSKNSSKICPAQQRVAQLLFERGFQVREDGKVVSGGIEIPHTQIGKEIGVERRAVDSTVQTILSKNELKRIYMNLRQVCSLQEVAREFNLSVIVFVPENATQTGIIANVTKKVSETGLSIRQALAEDASTSEHPKLTLILEGRNSFGTDQRNKETARNQKHHSVLTYSLPK